MIPSILDLVTITNGDHAVRMAAITGANAIPDGEVRMLGNLLVEKSGGRWSEYVFVGPGEIAKGHGDSVTAENLVKWMAEQPSMVKEVDHQMGPAMPATLTQRGAVHKALVGRILKGSYDHAAAMRLFRKCVMAGAKKWAGPAISPATRDLAATLLADDFVSKVRKGEYDHHIPKGANVRSLLVKSEDAAEDAAYRKEWARRVAKLPPMPGDLGVGKPVGAWRSDDASGFSRPYERGWAWIEGSGSGPNATGPFVISIGPTPYGGTPKRYKAPDASSLKAATGAVDAAIARISGKRDPHSPEAYADLLEAGFISVYPDSAGNPPTAPKWRRSPEFREQVMARYEKRLHDAGVGVLREDVRHASPLESDKKRDAAHDKKMEADDMARRGGGTPPGSGWQNIPRGKKGGYRRKKGSGYEYWYPGKGITKSIDPDDDTLGKAIAEFSPSEFGTVRRGSVVYEDTAALSAPIERSVPGLRARMRSPDVRFRDEPPKSVLRSPSGHLLDPRSGIIRRK